MAIEAFFIGKQIDTGFLESNCWGNILEKEIIRCGRRELGEGDLDGIQEMVF